MKTAVIYARYSSDSQTEQSIEGQLHVCNEYAKNNDIVVLGTYIDRAMTGTNDHRPSFQNMLKDSHRKEWNYVLVYKLDRFSRNKYETAIHKKTLRDNGVKVLSAMENIPDTPEGIILESLLEGMNQYYSAELSQKVRRGMNESRRKGNFTGGFTLYGYKVKDKKVTISEDEAAAVKYIYEQYSAGVYVKDIIAALTERGIYFHGKKFARNTVYNILKNEKYSGIYRHGEETFDNIYPQIVPTEIYEKVRAKTNANRYGKRSVEVVYLLRGKLRCGYCGSPISAETGTSNNGGKIRYYKCLGRKHRNGCKKSMVRKEILEKYVIDHVIEMMSKPEIQNEIADELLAYQEKIIEENSAIGSLEKEIRRTENTITNIMNAVEQGGATVTTMNRMRELEAKLDELQKNLTIEKSKTAYRLSREEILMYYRAGLEKTPKLLIEYLIKEIKLYDDKMIITYNTPRPIDLDASQGFSFYNKNVKIARVIQNRKFVKYENFRLIMRV